MHTLIFIVLAIAALYFVYKYEFANRPSPVTGITQGVTAFAKVADLDGKIIALKTTAAVKKAEAEAVHAALDEVHTLLG